MIVLFFALIGCLCANDVVQANAVNDVIGSMANVTATNCHSDRSSSIYLSQNTVSHVPRFRDPEFVQPKNRSSLQYAYNIAFNRALFLSAIYAWTNSSREFESQPGLHYLYMSEAANVLAGPDDVTASGLFYHTNRSYPNWIPVVHFNQTLPLFAVRASRGQDRRLVNVTDLGNVPETNYTNPTAYPQNEFIRDRLSQSPTPRNRLTTYRIDRHNGDGTISHMAFDAPGPSQDHSDEPARVTRPYFDCGQSNKWLVTAASEAIEFLPRYTFWIHLRHLKPVATSTVDVEFSDIDINPCPLSLGNTHPNAFAGLAQCPGEECKTLSGHGLTDSGFVCCGQPACAIEERISAAEFTRGQRALNQVEPSTCSAGTRHLPERQLPSDFWDMADLRDLFEVQGRTGLRMAHFLSNFLQNNDPADNQRNVEYIHQMWNDFFANRPTIMTQWGPERNMTYDRGPEPDSPMRYLRVDNNLERKWIEAEAFSTVMADAEIVSAGIFLEPGVFPASTQGVSAFAWKSRSQPAVGHVADLRELREDFTTETFYIQARAQFSGVQNAHKRVEFRSTSTVRTGYSDKPKVQAVPGQVTYFATDYEAGHWLPPHFHCDEKFADWTVSYVAPIFAKDMATGIIDFGGVAKVDAYFTENHLLSRPEGAVSSSNNK